MIVIAAAGVWNCGAAALASHSWLEPIPPGCMRLDAMGEIWRISSALNVSLPAFVLALVGSAIVLAARRPVPTLALLVASILFLASMLPVLAFWRFLVQAHGPEINLWQNHIWWHIG